MKIRIHFLLSIVAAFSLWGCIRENKIDEPITSDRVLLSAQMEMEPETKTYISELTDGMYYPLWAQSDSLAVFTAPKQNPSVFTLVSGEGGTRAVFEGTMKGERYVAVFPFSPAITYDNNSLTLTLPAIQKSQPGSFSATGFPMVAISEDEVLSFKNLCSVIRLSILGSGVVDRIVLSTDGGVLSGEATLDLSYSEAPELVMKDGGSKEVTLACLGTPLKKETPTYFYVVVPAGTYNGLSIKVETFTGTETKTITRDIVIKRSELRPVSQFLVDAPPIDLDNLPDNQVWYKSKSGGLLGFEHLSKYGMRTPFDAKIISHINVDDYGLIILDAPLKTIHLEAFSEWELSELHIPDCVEVMEPYAMPTGLDALRIPGSLKTMEPGNLRGHKRIYGPLVAKDNRSIIRNKELLDVLDTDLEQYETPDGIEVLSSNSLSDKSFKRVIISEGVLVSHANFSGCGSLEEIVFPESLSSIDRVHMNNGFKGFYGSSRCTTNDHMILISASQRRIVGLVPDENLTSYSFPEGVELFEEGLEVWPRLRVLGIPSTMMQIHPGFSRSELESLEGVNVSEDGRCVIIHGVLNAFAPKGIKDYTIPGEAAVVRDYRLANCNELESIAFAEGVKKVMSYSLSSCPNLKEVRFPTTLEMIGEGCFFTDYNLEKVFLPIRIPPKVFSDGGHGSLFGWAKEGYSKLKIYVPAESLESYLSNEEWESCWQYMEGYHFDTIDPAPTYTSTDFSLDGKVTIIQEAVEGNGIDLVLMGDAYSDRQIKSGRYLEDMKKIIDDFFEIEPYRSFRHLFNVYVVNAVSESEDYSTMNTVFKSDPYLRKCDSNMGLEYALKAIPESRLGESTIMVVTNADNIYSQVVGLGQGYALLFEPSEEGDFGGGCGFACFTNIGGRSLVQHEVGGHAFAKLRDEYYYDTNLTIPEATIEFATNQRTRFGWNKNIDFTSDPKEVYWSRFLLDFRYSKEQLGVYEGGFANYPYGVYRPSRGSIMDSFGDGFNAPSREAIYYRIHKLAYGALWSYDYEEFVKWDQGEMNIRPTSFGKNQQTANTLYRIVNPLPVTTFIDWEPLVIVN